jgi:hypothetical protein
MKGIFVAAAVFLTLGTNAQRYLQKSESVMFSFQTQNGKYVMLAKDKHDAYIVYRFGTADSVEFEYPEKNMDSWGKFKYAYYLRGGAIQNAGMDLNYLHFTNNGYKYYIYDVYYAEKSRSSGFGIGVTDLKTNKTITIKGAEKTRKGTILDLRDSNLVERDTDLIQVDEIKP